MVFQVLPQICLISWVRTLWFLKPQLPPLSCAGGAWWSPRAIPGWASAKPCGTNYRCCIQCLQEKAFQRWTEFLGAARTKLVKWCQERATTDALNPRGCPRSLGIFKARLWSTRAHPLPSSPSLLGYVRKITQVTLIISGRIRVKCKEGLPYKYFWRSEHVPKKGERHHLPFGCWAQVYSTFLKSCVLRKCIESILFKMHWECSLFKAAGMPLSSPVCKYRFCLTRILNKQGSLAESFWQRTVWIQSFLETEKWIQFVLTVPFRPLSLGLRQT